LRTSINDRMDHNTARERFESVLLNFPLLVRFDSNTCCQAFQEAVQPPFGLF
jgi:hypothetical protein